MSKFTYLIACLRLRQNKRSVTLMASFVLLITATLIFLSATTVQAYSNHPIHWGFKRSTDHVPPSAGKAYDNLLARYDSFYLGDTNKKELYLTFDNGYENGYTAQIMDVLKEKKVPAAFFVTGHYLKDQPDLVKRMVEEGHIVGNHSWHHPDFTQVSDKRLSKELRQVEEEFERLTGVQGLKYLRPPRGIFSERTLALSQKEGYMNVFWSLAYVDWKIDQQKGWTYAFDSITRQLHPGAVMLLHTVSRDNAEALAQVIDHLRKEGYEFRSLDDLVIEKEIQFRSIP
jgi:peptidoglycan-N-acetylmuramic acid deacetylase